jgi:hypothetical protein
VPSISATLQISTGDLTRLQTLPTQLATLVGEARQSLQSVTRGGGGNALGALLGNLDGLGARAAALPDLGPLLASVQSVLADLPAAGFADLAALRKGIDEMLGVLGPVTDLVLRGKLDASLELGAQRAVDAVGGLLRPGDDTTGLLGQLEQFLVTFQSLQSWRQRPPTPQALVDLLTPLLIGLPTDLLDAPHGQLRAALDPLRQLLPAGAELAAWRASLAERVSVWTQLTAQLSGPAIDWNAVELALRAELNALVRLRATRDLLISASLSNLGRIDLSRVGQIGSAVLAVPRPDEFRLSQIIDGMRSYLEGLAATLEAWTPTPDEVRALTTDLTGTFRRFLDESPLGELRNLLLSCHHRLMLAIEELPFRDLAAQVERALRKVAEAIQVVDPDLIRRPIHELFETIDAKLKEIPVSEIVAAVQAVWQRVDDVFQQINTQLAGLSTTLQGLVARVATLKEELQPTLDGIASAVGTIDAQLSAFDLTEASSVIVDNLHQLRDTVAALDFSKLPDPALAALHAGAQILKNIDVAGAVNPPLNDELGKVDPTPLLASVSATLSAATSQLTAIDPASVVKQLDAPVDELLKALAAFGPDALRALLDAALEPLDDALRALDFSQVLAPVTRLYAELLARVESVLDPDQIFTPLNDLVQPVVTVIDAIQPSRLMGFATATAGPMAQAAASPAGPPAAFAGARATLQAIPEAAEASEPLFGFRPGDMLMPVIDLHRQLMQVVEGVTDEALATAATLLHEALSLRLQSLLPSSVELEVGARLDVVAGEFDAAAVTGRLLPAGEAFQVFVETFTAKSAELAGADAEVTLRIGGLLGAADPIGLAPAPSQSESLVAASAHVQAGLRLDGLQDAARHLSELQAMLPPFLQTATVTAESLRQFLRDLDPAPIRIAINAAFDRIGRWIVALQGSLMAGIESLMRLVEEFLLPITPAALLELADRLHQAVKEQLLAFHPNTFKDEVRLIFDAVLAQVKAFDPVVIVTELNQERDRLRQTLHDFVGGIQPDPAQFVTLQQRLAALKPSEILKPAVESLKPVSEILAKIDITVILEPLVDAVARVRAQVPEIVAEIEAAIDAVLDAIPEGGGSRVSASVSVG